MLVQIYIDKNGLDVYEATRQVEFDEYYEADFQTMKNELIRKDSVCKVGKHIQGEFMVTYCYADDYKVNGEHYIKEIIEEWDKHGICS